MSGELVPAEQVYEGEFVDERAAVAPRFDTTWRHSRVVPNALKSQQALEVAAKDALVWSPPDRGLQIRTIGRCRGARQVTEPAIRAASTVRWPRRSTPTSHSLLLPASAVPRTCRSLARSRCAIRRTRRAREFLCTQHRCVVGEGNSAR